MTKSIDKLMTSLSIVVLTDFTDFDMLNAMIASALKRLLDKHVRFRKRVSVEEQRAQKYHRFLGGRQIAYMIHEHFRATGAYEAVQGLPVCACIMTTSKISMFDGSSSTISQQATCTSQNYRTLFSFRPSWLCTIKKPFEIVVRKVTHDWRRL